MNVLPAWLDQVPGISYEPEKVLLQNLETWAQNHGWTVSDGKNLPYGLAERTDVLLERSGDNQRIRLAVLPKIKKSGGAIRVDSSSLKTVELLYEMKTSLWRVEAGGVLVEDDVLERGWDWLIQRLM